MKSKVILLCVLLFCFKIVVSTSLSEKVLRQRALSPSNWQAPEQYLNTGFAHTQNVNALINSAHQNENAQHYFANQDRNNYETFGHNNNRHLVPLARATESSVNFGSPADGPGLYNDHISRVDGYLSNLNTYSSRTDDSQVTKNNQHYRNHNWQSQNQYVSPVSSGIVAADFEHLIPAVQEPYRNPGQYPQVNPQYYQGDRTYPISENYQRPLVDNSSNNRYKTNSGSRATYENFNVGNAVPSTVMRSGGNGFVENTGLVSPALSKLYNGVPSGITDILTSDTANNRYYKSRSGPSQLISTLNYGPSSITDNLAENSVNQRYINSYRPGLSKTSAVSNYNDRSFVTSEDAAKTTTGNRRFDTSKVAAAYVNDNNNFPAVDTGGGKSENIKNIDNYRPDSESGNQTLIYNYNDDSPGINENRQSAQINTHIDVTAAPTDNGTSFGNNRYLDNDVPQSESRNPTPSNNTDTISTNNGGPFTLNQINQSNFENNQYVEHNESQYESGKTRPFDNRDSNQNTFHHLFSGGQSFDFKDILVAHPQIQNNLNANKKRYVIIHPNGTLEYLDSLETIAHNLPYYRFVHTNDGNIDLTNIVEEGEAVNATNLSAVGSSDTNQIVANNSNSALKSRNFDNSSTTVVTNNSTVMDNYTSNYTSPAPLVSSTLIDNQPFLPTTNVPVFVGTTPTQADDLIDGIIMISPIETVTDNPPEATTTNEPDILDTVTYLDNNQDDVQERATSTSNTGVTDKVQNDYTTTESSSSLSSSINDNNDGLIFLINYSQSNDTTAVNQMGNGTESYQTATYDPITNTDVPANRDDHSSVSTISSVESIVNNSSDNSTIPGDNPLESSQSEPDITVILDTSSDDEGDTITITIGVSGSPGDGGADSSNDDQMVLININTEDSDEDDNRADNKTEEEKETTQDTASTSNCDKNPTNDDRQNEGKNFEIDLSNIKDKPTVWFRTTDQNLFDKLIADDDAPCSIVYLFQIPTAPVVEKDRQTTIYPNGTRVIELTETIWEHKDDPVPKIIKATKIVQSDDN